MKKGLFSERKVLSNTIWIVAGKVLQMLISFFVGIFTARYLGPANYGLINTATAYCSFLLPFCSLGLSAVFVKFVLQNPEKEGTYLGSGIVMRTVSSILAMVVMILFVCVSSPDDKTFQIVCAVYSLTLVFQSFDLFELWYQAKLQSKYASAIGVIAYLIASAYKVWLLISGKSVVWFAFAMVLDYGVIAVIYMTYTVRKNKIRLKSSFGCMKEMLQESKHFILANVLVMMYASLDKIMIKHMLGAEEVGLYAVAVAICAMWTFVLTAIINSMRPAIIAVQNDKKAFEKKIVQLYGIVIWLSVLVSAGICVLAKFIIGILYGEEYIGAVKALQIVTWYTSFSYLGVARSIWTVCRNKQKYEKYFALSGAVSNFVLNIIFIRWMGIEGAAIASLLTQIITNGIVPYLIKDTRENARFVLRAFNIKNLIG